MLKIRLFFGKTSEFEVVFIISTVDIIVEIYISGLYQYSAQNCGKTKYIFEKFTKHSAYKTNELCPS